MQDLEKFRAFQQCIVIKLHRKTLTLFCLLTLYFAFNAVTDFSALSIDTLLSCLRKCNASVLGHILGFNYKSFQSTSCFYFIAKINYFPALAMLSYNF